MDEECSDKKRKKKMDPWAEWRWFWFRRFWDVLAPLGTKYPPGFGDDGPGSNEGTWGPSDEEKKKYYDEMIAGLPSGDDVA